MLNRICSFSLPRMNAVIVPIFARDFVKVLHLMPRKRVCG